MTDTASTDEQSTATSAEPGRRIPDRPNDNPAVARCILARQRAYNREFAESNNEVHAGNIGEEAYRHAMPPLSGYYNIRDFIACVTYAVLTDMLRPRQTDQLFEAAKIAISALRNEPKTALQGPA